MAYPEESLCNSFQLCHLSNSITNSKSLSVFGSIFFFIMQQHPPPAGGQKEKKIIATINNNIIKIMEV